MEPERRSESVDSVLGSLVTEVEAHVEDINAQRAPQSLSRVGAVLEQHATSRAESAGSEALSGHTDSAHSAASVEHEETTVGTSAQPGHIANSVPGQTDARQEATQAGQHKPLLQAAGSSYPIPGPQKELIAPADAPESLTKSSKLLVLKQRRLDSLSSSLDLSRESSFDTSAQHHSSQHMQPVQPDDFSEHTSSKSPLPLDSTTGLEGRKVALQRRSSSINRKASTLTDLFPSFAETRVKKQSAVLPAIKQPGELTVPLREATAAAKDAVEMQQILMQRHHAVMKEQKARQHRREATERLHHAQILETLLSESSERRAALEERQAVRAAQLLARQEQMATAAEARRKERLQLMAHLTPAPKPVTHKKELEQLRKIEDAESELRRLLTEHKQMFAAQEQQQELEQHQQQAAVQRAQGAKSHRKRRELDKEAANSWGFQAPSEKRAQQATALSLMPTAVASRKANKSSALPAFDQDAAAQQAFKREAVSRRLHDKEFHAKQSIRKRQQEYDQAVKARLAQDAAMNSTNASSKSSNARSTAKHAQHAPHAEQLPNVTAAVGGAGLVSDSMAGPRARKLQAFARHPRPPQLPPPPRQQSRIPDDVLLPDITGRSSKQLAYNSNSMDDLLMEDDTPRQRPVSVMEDAIEPVLLPPLISQNSSMRRLTQEVPS